MPVISQLNWGENKHVSHKHDTLFLDKPDLNCVGTFLLFFFNNKDYVLCKPRLVESAVMNLEVSRNL